MGKIFAYLYIEGNGAVEIGKLLMQGEKGRFPEMMSLSS